MSRFVLGRLWHSNRLANVPCDYLINDSFYAHLRLYHQAMTEDLFCTVIFGSWYRDDPTRVFKGIYVPPAESYWRTSIVSLVYCPESDDDIPPLPPVRREYDAPRRRVERHSPPRLPTRIKTPISPFKERLSPKPHLEKRPAQRERRSNAQSRQLCGQLNRRTRA